MIELTLAEKQLDFQMVQKQQALLDGCEKLKM